MERKTGERGLDAAIAALAAHQHGVVSRSQLLASGAGPEAIRHRLRLKRLHRVHRGVYAVGHPRLTRRGRLMAAVLASGEGALLSHRSAGGLWGIRKAGAGRPEVTVPRDRRRPGIVLRQSVVAPDERTFIDAIPVTTVPRTLLDLAGLLQAPDLRLAIEQAEALRLSDPLSLPDLLERYPRKQGTRALRRVLADAGLGAGVTRSELEDRFLTFVAECGLPRPRLNFWMQLAERWLCLDFLWPLHRVVVELDGYATHGTRAAFERDRRRDRLLQVADLRVVRVTWRQLHRDRPQLEADLRALLQPEPQRASAPITSCHHARAVSSVSRARRRRA